MPTKSSPEKDKLIKDIIEVFGVQIDFNKLTLEDLKKLHELLSNPRQMMSAVARAAKLKWSNKPIGEVLGTNKGGLFGLGILPIGGEKASDQTNSK